MNWGIRLKKWFVLFMSLGLALALAACSSTDDVSTGSSDSKDKKTEETKDDGSKKVDASKQSAEALGMKVNIRRRKDHERQNKRWTKH